VRVGGWVPTPGSGRTDGLSDRATPDQSDESGSAEAGADEEGTGKERIDVEGADEEGIDVEVDTPSSAPGASRLRAISDAVAVSWGLRRGHVVVVVALLLLAVVGAAAMVLRQQPVRESVTDPIARATVVTPGSAAPSPSATTSPSPAPLVIHVAGKVRRPGVLRLPAGARVGDAVTAAGGPLAGVDLTSLNLARPLGDGEQVLVGVRPPPGSVPAGSAGTAGSPGQGGAGSGGAGMPGADPVDLNTATVEQLDTLPGLGPVLAQRIIEYRSSRGRFESVEELREVTGIGERKFADLRDRVTVT
jgi:competence protein ComEA